MTFYDAELGPVTTNVQARHCSVSYRANEKNVAPSDCASRVQLSDEFSKFVYHAELYLQLFKVLDIYAWVHYTWGNVCDIFWIPDEYFAILSTLR